MINNWGTADKNSVIIPILQLLSTELTIRMRGMNRNWKAAVQRPVVWKNKTANIQLSYWNRYLNILHEIITYTSIWKEITVTSIMRVHDIPSFNCSTLRVCNFNFNSMTFHMSKYIKSLDLLFCKIVDKDVLNFKNNSALESIYLCGVSHGGCIIRSLSSCIQLRSFKDRSYKYSTTQIQFLLMNCKTLESLEVECGNDHFIPPLLGQTVRGQSNLTHLIIELYEIGDQTCQDFAILIKHCPKLTHLHLSISTITQPLNIIQCLDQFPLLTYCVLRSLSYLDQVTIYQWANDRGYQFRFNHFVHLKQLWYENSVPQYEQILTYSTDTAANSNSMKFTLSQIHSIQSEYNQYPRYTTHS